MPDFDQSPELSDRERLARFVEAVRWLLGQLVETGRDPRDEPLFDPELRQLMIDAWEEVQPEFGRLIAYTREANEESLIQHGLVGRQLLFKLRVVGTWWERFMERGGRRTLKWLIDMIDNVLDSLIEVVGAGGAVKEFKDALMGSVEE